MSSKAQQLRSTIASRLMSAFVVVLFFVPVLAMGVWVKQAFFTGPGDPRKVLSVSAIQQDTEAPALFAEPIVTVTFDDGWESIYSRALPILQELNIPTTQYIIAGTFDHPAYMSVAQIQSMQQAGHEIASHTMTHQDLTKLTPAALAWELGESKRILSEYFGTIHDFASPLGAKDSRTLAAIGDAYRSQRNTEGDPRNVTDHGVNIPEQFTKANIKGYTVRQTTTMDDLRLMLAFAKARNGWLVLTYHQVDDSGEEYAVSTAVLREQLSMLRASGVRIAPLGQVLDAYQATGEGQ